MDPHAPTYWLYGLAYWSHGSVYRLHELAYKLYESVYKPHGPHISKHRMSWIVWYSDNSLYITYVYATAYAVHVAVFKNTGQVIPH
jgi:hypothetical protein